MEDQALAEVRRFKNLRAQLTNCIQPIVIVCPWCGKQNAQDESFCCDLLRRAIQLVMSEPEREYHA